MPFEGEITGYDAENDWYKISYRDGDQEEFTANEVKQFRKHTQKYSATAPRVTPMALKGGSSVYSVTVPSPRTGGIHSAYSAKIHLALAMTQQTNNEQRHTTTVSDRLALLTPMPPTWSVLRHEAELVDTTIWATPMVNSSMPQYLSLPRSSKMLWPPQLKPKLEPYL